MNSRERYDTAVGDFIAWFWSASRLNDAADLILAGISEKDRGPDIGIPDGRFQLNATPDLRGVYLYLAMLSIENLLKGIWIKDNEHEFTSGRQPKRLVTHKLDELAELANVTFRSEERTFIALEPQVESLGRFPGPRHHCVDFTFAKDLDLNAMAMIYEALYIRLRDELLKDVGTD